MVRIQTRTIRKKYKRNKPPYTCKKHLLPFPLTQNGNIEAFLKKELNLNMAITDKDTINFTLKKAFRRMRQRAIAKTGNQELRKIHLYTCRYWRATGERHKKGNPDSVQYLLGHRSLMYVGLYARLSVDYFGNVQEYDVQEVDPTDKARVKYLLSQGYEDKVIGGVTYFRKAK